MASPRFPPMPRSHRFLLPALLLGVLLSSCATYPQRVSGAMREFEQARFAEAAEQFEKAAAKESEFLAGAEAGFCWLAAGEWGLAEQALERAVGAIRSIEERGAIGVGAGADMAAGLLVNDAARTYRGEGFERLAVHNALALAYLARGDLEGLRVETKRSEIVLDSEEDLYESDYAAGGLAHFLSATSYLLEEDLDDALIDFRRMVDRGTGLEIAGPEALRIAQRLGREDLVRELETRFAPTPLPDHPEPAWIVLIAGVGYAPTKYEERLDWPTPAGVVSFAAPQYTPRYETDERLEILAGSYGVQSSIVEDIDLVARENLEDRLGAVALRSAARNAGRLALRKTFEDDEQFAAAALVDLWSLFAERADLRSIWTLPASWQGLRMAVPPGVHDIVLRSTYGASGSLGRYELLPGETLFVIARTIGPSIHAHPVGGLRLDPTETLSSPGDFSAPIQP